MEMERGEGRGWGNLVCRLGRNVGQDVMLVFVNALILPACLPAESEVFSLLQSYHGEGNDWRNCPLRAGLVCVCEFFGSSIAFDIGLLDGTMGCV